MVSGMKIRYWKMREWMEKNGISNKEVADELRVDDSKVRAMTEKREFLTEQEIRRLVKFVGAENALNIIDFSHRLSLFRLAQIAVYGGVIL